MRLSNSKVDVSAMLPAVWPYLFKLNSMCLDVLGYELVITSAMDGEHSETSDHYPGLAIDMRTWTTISSGVQVSGSTRVKLFRAVSSALGVNWYVKNERNHFHCSYRPRHSGHTV